MMAANPSNTAAKKSDQADQDSAGIGDPPTHFVENTEGARLLFWPNFHGRVEIRHLVEQSRRRRCWR